jgi:SAM-dependent methyltransferase
MNAEEYERMYRLEDSYWWFVGRHHLIETFMRQTFRDRADLAILDIGCGTGAMSTRLTRWGEVTSADFSPLALGFCRRRSLSRLCSADAMRLPFRTGSFDAVVALDLVEHLSDDIAAVREFRRVLKPGGRFIATVPAYQSLWSAHDEALMHQRRYTASGFRDLCLTSGMRIRRLSYAMTFLLPVVWIVRRFTRNAADKKASLVEVPGAVNRVLVRLLAIENALIRRLSLPWGVSVLCVAENEAGGATG